MITLTIMGRHYYGNSINEAKAKAFDDIINQDLRLNLIAMSCNQVIAYIL